MLSRLKEWYRWLNGRKRYFAELETQNFITDVTIEQGHQCQEITLGFGEPIKDGNNAHAITVLKNGEAIHQDPLYAGESSYTLKIDSYQLNTDHYGLAIIDENDQVICSNRIDFTEV